MKMTSSGPSRYLCVSTEAIVPSGALGMVGGGALDSSVTGGLACGRGAICPHATPKQPASRTTLDHKEMRRFTFKLAPLLERNCFWRCRSCADINVRIFIVLPSERVLPAV